MVCRNRLPADERARKRRALLAAPEKEPSNVATAVTRQRIPLRGTDRIGLAVRAVLNRDKMAKRFTMTVTDHQLAFARNDATTDAESRLDVLYVIRVDVLAASFSASEVVRCYKDLSRAERAFRSLKRADLEMRPIHHRLADRARAHGLMRMLACYVDWHMRQALAPIMFDHQRRSAQRPRVARQRANAPTMA